MKERVYLRPIELSDTDNIVRWRNSESVRRNLFTQSLLTPEQHVNYFQTVVCSGKCRQYIIIVKNGADTPIGTVFLKNIDSVNKTAEFGIFIGEGSYRGKGFSTAATCRILEIAFEDLDLEEVVLFVVEDNIPARKSYERVGFIEVERRNHAFVRGTESLDVIEMKLTKKRWLNRTE